MRNAESHSSFIIHNSSFFMKNPIIVSLLLTFLFATTLQAQEKLSWKKHVKLADELYANSQYAGAGEHYRSAWKMKTKKKEFIYKAGESFFTVRDYPNAADCWKNVKDDNATYPLIGLRYARCLKQNGEYEAASSELVNFLGHYKGADKATVSQIVQNELRGCELAAQLAVKGGDPNLEVEHLSANVNTPETEFAPFPYGGEALYYSSTMDKRAEIYRSLKVSGEWSKSKPIENFPVIENDHFCNGTLTPDSKRFYFTICQSEENWGGLTTRCDIYVTRRVGKTWTAPEKLPDYVNEPNVTTTHPFVVHDGSSEVLYFASNRSGGMGGMDIWYTTREIKSNANDFTLPINAGSRINTLGDEITPYYDQLEGKLYFASNGQISMGGLDIFNIKGARSNWEKAENAGTPLNSPADDFFFIKTTTGKGGFFVSNRTFGMEKIATTDEDIFAFTYKTPERQWVAKGEVLNKSSNQLMGNVEVALYEIMGTGQKRYISKIVSGDGAYDFAVEPSRKYYIEALKEGFSAGTYEFDTYDFATYTDFGAPLYMDAYDQVGGEEPVAVKEQPAPQPKKVVKTQELTVEPVKKPAVPKEEKVVAAKPEPAVTPPEAAEDKPAESGVTYKIQIIALSKFYETQSRYSNVKNLGTLETEYLKERGLYRVMIGGYSSVEDALGDLPSVQSNRDFKGAFIVEYKNGERGKIVRK
jgi:cell division septation protein DedD